MSKGSIQGHPKVWLIRTAQAIGDLDHCVKESIALSITSRNPVSFRRPGSRNRWSAAVSEGPAAAVGAPPGFGPAPERPEGSDMLRLVLRTQPRSENRRRLQRFSQILIAMRATRHGLIHILHQPREGVPFYGHQCVSLILKPAFSTVAEQWRKEIVLNHDVSIV